MHFPGLAILGCIFLGWPDMHFSPGKMHVFCMLASPGKYIPKMHSFFGWEMRKSNTQNQVTAKIADGPQVLVWASGSCYPRALGSHIINHIQALFLASDPLGVRIDGPVWSLQNGMHLV